MLPLQEGLVYGPVRSRRLGYSLGINILPRHTKLCTFNCTYCQYGWTKSIVRDGRESTEPWPSSAAVVKAVTLRLKRLLAAGDPIDRLTLAGNGEPTLHPQFPAVVRDLLATRDAVAPGLPLAALSNSSTLDLPGVVGALNALDERYMKLDAGEPTILRRINAAQIPLDQIVAGLGRLKPFTVQAMFVRDRLGRIDNASDLAVALWIGTLQALHPMAVQIYSIDRAPAWPYLQAIPPARLEEISRRACAAGLTARAFGAGGAAIEPNPR
ncbi:MAG TPA: radical SAM protein [Vicinamibacterales bacterium]|jgi:wyosine [tRNA(Phe)-imidazoG37] synthetase (radical SAM superfamily)